MTAFTIGALVAIGFLLLAIEVFVPGGVVGIIGVFFILAGLVGAGIQFGASVAFPLGVACLVLGVGIFFTWVKYFPDSRIGSRFNLKTQVGKESGYSSQDPSWESLTGKRGETLSDLHPSGIAKIDGKRLDVVSEGAYIPKGTPIEVSQVNSNRIVVKMVREVSDAAETG